jgi:5,10-methylenetetrahydromethanopterin reductase
VSCEVASGVTRWGLWLHAVRPLPELAELAAAAEARGAAAILVADEGTDRDLYVTLAALAQRTRTALLVAAVTNPHSRHPVATAAAFASLAELAPGRIVAGFGAGGGRVFGPMGLAPERPFTALRETIDIVDDLLAGKVVDRPGGVFAVRGASLPWSGGALPVAVAGRGPRVEELAAERADWVLLAGKSVEKLEALVARLRAGGVAARGRAPAIAWNPVAGWTEALAADVRAHLAYITVDLPPADRRALGVDDDLVARLRAVVSADGPEAAGPLVPQAVVDAYAVVGDRPHVARRLAELRARIQPELLVFDAGDYSLAFVEEVAALAAEAGAVTH